MYSSPEMFEDFGLPPGFTEEVPGIEKFLNNAGAKIDSYLRGRYKLPLVAPYPTEIVEAEIHIAAYDITVWRGWDPEKGIDQSIVDRRDNAIAWLKDVSAGRANIAVTADSTPTKHDGGPRVSSGGPRADRAINDYSGDC